MKILQINSVCGVGSTGRIATDIHQLLKSQGHESWIAYGRGEAENCENTIKIGNKVDNYLHVAKTRIWDQHGFGSKKATEEFIKKIIELDPDVVHLHNIHGYYINIEMLFEYLKKSRKKVIWTLHDCWAFTGHCTYFDYANCNKWKTHCGNCPEKSAYPKSNLFDSSDKNFTAKKEIFNEIKNLTIITPSIWLKELVDQSFLKRNKTIVINNGIDLETFKPTTSMFRQKYGIENKFVILGVASVWDRRKGLKYFLEASKHLKLDEIIILVGLTKKQSENLPNNIIGIPKTSNIKELAEIYSTANVFVNPTLEDNFPTTNLESLACGTPVITFDTGGSIESINKKCGIIVEKGNQKSLMEAIEKFRSGYLNSEDSVNRSRLFDKNKKFEEYIELYEE